MSTQESFPSRQRLISLIEAWYVWLVSNPEVLFHPGDTAQMQEPVLQFDQSAAWLSQSAVANTEWFLSKGSPLILQRLKEGDYDAYES
ncbi:hypothetical protein [Paenibacillus sp. y28]|uniref:hypothetical protein n=1 Tax=Paenibacillus sp. y28 TaxID=3129110 RepID=UPI00301A03FC